MTVVVRGDFVLIEKKAETTVALDREGVRARFLLQDLESYEYKGLVVKVKQMKDSYLVCIALGAEVYWYDHKDLTKIKES